MGTAVLLIYIVTPLSFAHLLLIAAPAYSFSWGLTEPGIPLLVSTGVAPGRRDHGTAQGTLNSVRSAASLLGPPIYGALYGCHPVYPFLLGGLCGFLPAVLLVGTRLAAASAESVKGRQRRFDEVRDEGAEREPPRSLKSGE
eukprot:GHVU01138970.1.p3 GENE.GHVU01138970.1~~GHVU01138970.1.p3  ORF type:complete len:142 (-),score=16.30 GHVU01138970.1:450-875(-)